MLPKYCNHDLIFLFLLKFCYKYKIDPNVHTDTLLGNQETKMAWVLFCFEDFVVFFTRKVYCTFLANLRCIF